MLATARDVGVLSICIDTSAWHWIAEESLRGFCERVQGGRRGLQRHHRIDQKGWTAPDIEMAHYEIEVP